MEKYLENLVGISGKILFLILRSSRLAGYWKKKKRTNFRIQPRSDFVHRAIELSALEHLFIRVIRTARIRPRLARTSSWKKFCE